MCPKTYFHAILHYSKLKKAFICKVDVNYCGAKKFYPDETSYGSVQRAVFFNTQYSTYNASAAAAGSTLLLLYSRAHTRTFLHGSSCSLY